MKDKLVLESRPMIEALLALDLARRRKMENARFMKSPPRTLKEELRWQIEVELRARAREVRARQEEKCRKMKWQRKHVTKLILHEAYRRFETAYASLEEKERILGYRPSPAKRRFTLYEAYRIRRQLLPDLVESLTRTACQLYYKRRRC